MGCGAAAKEEEAKPPALVDVEKASTDQTLREWTELIGSTQPLPDKIARVTTAVEAQVLWVLSDNNGQGVKEGQWVKKGDPIARLDDRVFLANLARGKAGLDKLRNQQEQADVAVEKADVEVKRLEKLKSDKVTVADADIAKARLDLKDARLKAKSVGEDLKVAQADLRALETQHAFYTLTAPIDGYLGRIEVARGQTLPIGTRVAEVLDLKKEIDVLCFVPPANIGKIQVGRPAVFVRDAPGDTTLPTGTVVFKDDQAQPDTGNSAVKIRFPNGDLKLTANAVVRVRVLTRVKEHCDTIPEDAVLEDQDPPGVVVVRETKEEDEKEATPKAFRLPVKLGIRDRHNKRIEILELDPEHSKDKTPEQRRKDVQAALYVVQGGHGLEDKDKVKVKEAKEKEK
jgi:RND family efflux transporter MFP subunit